MDLTGIEEGFIPSADGKCSESSGGMVAAAFPEAARAGAEMLKRGGNAVDAACAASLALGVCEPQASGLGGQTMAMISMGGRVRYIDGSGRIPGGASAERISADELKSGYRAGTVPSTPAVLGWMHERYGRLPWAQLLEPAIHIAKNGYEITPLQHRLQKNVLRTFDEVPSHSGARYFLKNGRTPFQPGERFCQPDLARLLAHLSHKGPRAFYTGRVAKMIADDMRRNNGLITEAELAQVPVPRERRPLRLNYRGLAVYTPPPPSPGRGLVMMLKLLGSVRKRSASAEKPNPSLIAEIIRRVLTALGENPVSPSLYEPENDPLLGDLFSERSAREILSGVPAPASAPLLRSAGGETTHLSVMDGCGNAVGITQSVNLVYGAKAAAEGLGFLYNNYLLDSNLTDPGHPHYLKPGGMPVSMVCPTVIHSGKEPRMVTGSPGSDRILSAVFQFLVHVLEGGLSIREAMEQPRLHCTPDGLLSLEQDRFDAGTAALLAARYGEPDRRTPWSFFLGAIHAVLRTGDGKRFQGVAEARRDGAACGFDP